MVAMFAVAKFAGTDIEEARIGRQCRDDFTQPSLSIEFVDIDVEHKPVCLV